MNEFFVNITKSLDIHDIPTDTNHDNLTFENVFDEIVHKFRSHPSISKITNVYSADKIFDFKNVEGERVKKYIDKLDPRKSAPESDIPAKIFKDFSDHYCELLTKTYNSSREARIFPDELKKADVSPLFKKGVKSKKENYRPIIMLQNLSNVFERIMFDDINDFMSSKFSPLLSGFRSKYSSQHALLSMNENWHRELDKGNFVSAILMDLSKALDCMNHALLIAKLHA